MSSFPSTERSGMEAAIFDMDGLLLDSESIYQAMWKRMGRERGVLLDERFTAAICGTCGPLEEEVIRRFVPGVEPRAFIDECKERVYRLEAEGIPLKPGAAEIVRACHGAGLKLAVASSSPRQMVVRNLEIVGLAPFFPLVVSGEEVARGKPAPDIFLRAAEKLGCAPARCWVLEDSPNGIRAAHAAGMRGVMVPDSLPATEELRALAWGVFPDLLGAWEKMK
ncbi:MAG: HAD family hydrolase [bacterium]